MKLEDVRGVDLDFSKVKRRKKTRIEQYTAAMEGRLEANLVGPFLAWLAKALVSGEVETTDDDLIAKAAERRAARGRVTTEPKQGTPDTDWSRPSRCRHLGEVIATDRVCGLCGKKGTLYTVRECSIHGECSERKRSRKVANCLTCEEYEPILKVEERVTIKTFSPTSFIPAKPLGGFLRNGLGQPADHFQNIFRGGPVFLLCGGPSLADYDLDILRHERGTVTAAINNAGAFFPADMVFMVDSPIRFHETMWDNPRQIKFTRIAVATDEIRRLEKGEWVGTGKRANQMPNCYFYKVCHFFTKKNFLDRPSPAWQAEWRTPDSPGGKEGKRHVKRSTFFVAIRMLWWLGFRTVFLLGADFHYKPEKTYAFEGCNKSRGACGTNNTSMGVIREWMNVLQPEFLRRGFHIYNCTPGSKLDAFPFVDFDDAVDAVAQRGAVDCTRLYGG